MNFDEYQSKATETAIYDGQHTVLGLMYAGLGAANEAGEVAGKIKKVFRDKTFLARYGFTFYDAEVKAAVKAEVGDCLWYIAQVANEMGFDLSDAAESNLRKLADRKARGVLGGSGDNR